EACRVLQSQPDISAAGYHPRRARGFCGRDRLLLIGEEGTPPAGFGEGVGVQRRHSVPGNASAGPLWRTGAGKWAGPGCPGRESQALSGVAALSSPSRRGQAPDPFAPAEARGGVSCPTRSSKDLMVTYHRPVLLTG